MVDGTSLFSLLLLLAVSSQLILIPLSAIILLLNKRFKFLKIAAASAKNQGKDEKIDFGVISCSVENTIVSKKGALVLFLALFILIKTDYFLSLPMDIFASLALIVITIKIFFPISILQSIYSMLIMAYQAWAAVFFYAITHPGTFINPVYIVFVPSLFAFLALLSGFNSYKRCLSFKNSAIAGALVCGTLAILEVILLALFSCNAGSYLQFIFLFILFEIAIGALFGASGAWLSRRYSDKRPANFGKKKA